MIFPLLALTAMSRGFPIAMFDSPKVPCPSDCLKAILIKNTSLLDDSRMAV